MRRKTLVGLSILLSCLALPCLAQEKHPVYVGAAACASCHQGETFGHQYGKWLLSKHAQAYADLAKPEAKEIAEWSGIPVEPQESPMCLGCHSTGAEAEDWEKDPGFSLLDGVQCEKCHGAGSEYMDVKIMTNREAAFAAGLILQTPDDCMGCHAAKGSHDAVLKRPPIDIAAAWQAIAHPTPEPYKSGTEVPLPQADSGADGAPQYTGTIACGECHKGPQFGYQYSKWRTSKHADAFASLTTPAAVEIARQMGVSGPPEHDVRCLKCHSTAYHKPAGGFLDTFSIAEGVGCESCHGPGSQYSPEDVMRDPAKAKAAGLWETNRETCAACHENAHGKPFDYETALAAIAHPTEPPRVVERPRYKTPHNLAFRPDGKEVYVTCEESDSVAVIDPATWTKVAEIAVGQHPMDVTFSPDGQRAYATNWLDDSISVIDVAARKTVTAVPVGDEPRGLLTNRSGKYLYVLNASTEDISVIDTESLAEVKRLAASRSPWSLALSPDGTQMLVTNALFRLGKFRMPSVSEVTIIDAERAVVEDRIAIPNANLVQGVAWHPSGEYALVTLNRTKNLVPMTRLLQGWTITNGLAVIWRDGRVDQVLLDEPMMCFPDPADVAITPDGTRALVTSSGSDRVAVVDLEKLISMLKAADDHQREKIFPNHLGKPTEFVVSHLPTKNAPLGIVISPDGRTALTANSLDDSLSVIDLTTLETEGRVSLGGPAVITKVRYGQQLFHSANITLHRQFSCHSCHPGGHIDGITYDTQPDGIGLNPVDNRTMRGILDTAPFKWEGTNPTLSRQCGPRLSVFFTRIQPFTPEELSAVDNYICTIPRPPNRYRPLGAELTEAQRRGRLIFDRTRTNDGRVIPKQNRCVTCHFPPLYTDRKRHDVGTQYYLDEQGRFDTPHLNNIYDSAPYLHNGMANTLEEIWTVFNPHDTHGVTNDMTKDQLNDLIEYLKTL